MKYIIVAIILLFMGLLGKAQNNSIKGIVWGLGESFITFGVWQGALSYEYNLTENHSLIIDASTIFASGYSEDCKPPYAILYSGSISYRYYFISKSKLLNKLWVSPGLKYQKYDQQSCYTQVLSNYYGIKLIIGKQINIPKSDNWKIDIGVGTSFGNRVYSYFKDDNSGLVGDEWVEIIDYTIPEPKFLFLPEFILRIGYSF